MNLFICYFIYLFVLESANNTEKQIYFVFYERDFIAEALSFIDGLMWIFSLYYMNNEQYPSSSSLKMEFLQRFVIDIQMDEFRGNKKRKCHQNKVISLTTKLQKIKSDIIKFNNFNV